MRAFLTVFAGALLLALWVFSIVDCIRTDAMRTRGLPKPAWVLIVILLPIVGGILWLTIGKDRPGKRGAGPARPMYPDDDMEFLRQVDSDREHDQRIRDLEAKLAELDDDGTGDQKTGPNNDSGPSNDTNKD